MSLIYGTKKDIQEKPNTNLATVISETTEILSSDILSDLRFSRVFELDHQSRSQSLGFALFLVFEIGLLKCNL